jgi:RNase H-fold protein (predicted Holliday junction resolvase)
MAKGIRSKCKRASRSQRRNTLSIPVAQARTAKISEQFAKELKDKESCSSIVGLKASMNKSQSMDADDKAEEEIEEAEGAEEVVTEETEEEKAAKAAAQLARVKEKFLEVKAKGMKGRRNPGKKLDWF